MGCSVSNHQPVKPIKRVEVTQRTNENGTPKVVPKSNFLMAVQSPTRRLSRSELVLQELSKQRANEMESKDPKIEEIFNFSDFSVSMKNASPSTRLGKRGNRKQSVRPGQSLEQFEFGDFCVRMEDSLDEAIIKTYESSAFSSGGYEPYNLENFCFPPRAPTQTRLKLEMKMAPKQYNMYTLIGHPNKVKCVALSPTEKYYVSSANEDLSVSMFDIYSGKEIVSFFGHEDSIISVSYSLDCKLLATTSRDNTMMMWDAVTGRQLFIFDHDKVVICCSFSHDSRFLVSGCQDMVCRVWDTKKRREMAAFSGHTGIVVCLDWAPDDSMIVSGGSDQILRLWDPRTGIGIRQISGHGGIILSCQFSAVGDSIVSNDERTIKVWDWKEGRCLTTIDVATLKRPSTKSARKLAWSITSFCPSVWGSLIIGVANDRMVSIFNPLSGDEVLSLNCKAPVYSLSSGLHSKIVFGDAYGNIYVTDLF
eukprot:NODE_1324_length_2010_cov_43.453100_g1119_i0.p1 GENE.NODE_1324_length_2010_cov_43.453100_g1119_i0~~NODE_1324_length_2010_cov_43.453100_g1119_i0.p1  ORF type:complete len:478 (+),score=65.11 NODE_1324_length_2010_cov_43.453100_g1119_i0:84-1517(+)